jgi:hypothetical protein
MGLPPDGGADHIIDITNIPEAFLFSTSSPNVVTELE